MSLPTYSEAIINDPDVEKNYIQKINQILSEINDMIITRGGVSSADFKNMIISFQHNYPYKDNNGTSYNAIANRIQSAFSNLTSQYDESGIETLMRSIETIENNIDHIRTSIATCNPSAKMFLGSVLKKMRTVKSIIDDMYQI